MKFIDGEINLKGKSEFSPIESVYDDEQEMLKKVWETRKQLSEERWILKTKEESPKTTQPSFIALKTIDGELDHWSMIINENEMETLSNYYISSCLVLITFLE